MKIAGDKVQHALSCKKGGFVSIRHNEVRDSPAEILKQTCSDVSIETPLQRITNKTFQIRTSNVSDEQQYMLQPEVSGRQVKKRIYM